jgi:MraZ protein
MNSNPFVIVSHVNPCYPIINQEGPLRRVGSVTGVFLSTTTNGVDAKGRVSVPADFRAVVRGGPFDGVIVWPSFDGPYLEGGGQKLLDTIAESLEAMDPYDEDREALEHAIFGSAKPLSFDANGRVSLPKEFAEHAGIGNKAVFVGLSSRFQIWAPEAYEAHRAAARTRAKEKKHALRISPRVRGEG